MAGSYRSKSENSVLFGHTAVWLNSNSPRLALGAKFGGMEVSDARRLRALELENGRLKKLLAESELDKAMLKELLAKN